MPKLRCRCVLIPVWGGSMWSGLNIVSPLTDDQLWRGWGFAGENLRHAAASGIFLLHCNHPLPRSPPHTETWPLGRLCVFISLFFRKTVFFFSSLSFLNKIYFSYWMSSWASWETHFSIQKEFSDRRKAWIRVNYCLFGVRLEYILNYFLKRKEI